MSNYAPPASVQPDRSPPGDGETETLGGWLAERDGARLVGRSDVLARLSRILDEDRGMSVGFVHGRGGIGKSAVLRDVARRAVRNGYAVRWIDGRDPAAAAPPQVEDVVTGPSSAPVLVVIDSYERIAGVGAHLRFHVLPQVPASTRVLIAGRQPPEPGWYETGWEAVTEVVALGPLSGDESREVLARLAVTHADTVTGIVRWAQGEPLALVVAAETVTSNPEFDWSDVSGGDDLAEVLAHRLVDGEVLSSGDDLLAVASIAHAVDAQLLDDVIENIAGDAAHRQLRALPFAEDLDDRVTLHDRVRTAVHQRLRRTNPNRERHLRRRLADHLAFRAHRGDVRYFAEMGTLFQDPERRRAWAADGLGAYQPDRARPGDEQTAAKALNATDADWWEGIRRWFVDAPECITTVRDPTGALAGFCIIMSRATAPPHAAEDPIVGPRLEDAATRYPGKEVVIWRDAFGFPSAASADPTEPTAAAIMAGVLHAGSPRLEVVYGTVVLDDPVSVALADFWESEAVPELQVVDGTRVVAGRIAEYRGGLIHTARALLYRELGLDPPPSLAQEAPTLETVRDALRNLHDPTTLADSPLADGVSTAERAESVRLLLTTGIREAFTDAPRDRMLRQTLELGYLDPTLGHEAAARQLHLARSTYFKHLGKAVRQLTHHLT